MNAQNIEVPNLPVNNLYDSAIHYSFINQPRSIQFSYSALQKIDKTDKKRIAKLFFNIGTQMTDMGRYDLLVAHIDTLFKTAKDLNIELLNGHGHFFKYKLLYLKNDKGFSAKSEMNQALKIYEAENAPEVVATYANLAEFMLSSKFEYKALDYFKILLEKVNGPEVSGRSKFDSYLLYASSLSKLTIPEKEQYLDSIYTYNQKAKELLLAGVKCKKRAPFFICCNDIYYGIRKNDLKLAHENVEKALQMKIDSNQHFLYAYVYSNIIDYYLHPNVQELDKAEYYCNQILSRQQDNSTSEYLPQIYRALGKIAFLRKNYDKMEAFYLKADSTFKANIVQKNVERISELETEFNINNMQLENERANRKLQTQSNRNYLLSISTFFLMVLFIVFVYLNKVLKSKNALLLEQKEILVNQKDSLADLVQKLKDTNLKLQNNLVAFAESNKALEYFSKHLSHDLRAPVRIMSQFANILIKKNENKLDRDSIQYLYFISDNANTLKKMILETLNNAIITQNIDIYEVDLNTVLNTVTKNLSPEIERLYASIDSEILPNIVGYESEMIQLFQNIIENALKYKQKDIAPRIRIRCAEDDNFIYLSFSDNGKGIKQENISTLFDIFSSSNYGNDSYGIGLNSCLSIVKNYGGSIDVESQVEVGSVFIITLQKQRAYKKISQDAMVESDV